MIVNPFAFSSSGGGGAFSIGLNFRATSSFVTDSTNETYVIGDAYPTTRAGVTFGWESGFTLTNIRNRNASNDRRIAGTHFDGEGDAIFRLDLPSTGLYEIRLGLGDPGGNAAGGVMKDNTTTLFTIATVSSSLNILDATGVARTQANWPSQNAAVQHTFASTILRWHVGGGSGNCGTCHIGVTKL